MPEVGGDGASDVPQGKVCARECVCACALISEMTASLKSFVWLSAPPWGMELRG